MQHVSRFRLFIHPKQGDQESIEGINLFHMLMGKKHLPRSTTLP